MNSLQTMYRCFDCLAQDTVVENRVNWCAFAIIYLKRLSFRNVWWMEKEVVKSNM